MKLGFQKITERKELNLNLCSRLLLQTQKKYQVMKVRNSASSLDHPVSDDQLPRNGNLSL